MLAVGGGAAHAAMQDNPLADAPNPPPYAHGAEPVEAISAFGNYLRSIPIDVPAFHGLEPRLGLTYDSLRANGFAGAGWGLSGLSTIERASRGRGAPRYDASDVYYLDGEELVPCTTLGGTHCTKLQSHLRITFDGANWLVWRKNGTKLTYTKAFSVTAGADGAWGTADDVAWRWALTNVTDTHGNAVTYQWSANQFGCCWIYPDSISYNGVVVKLYWEQRPDVETRANGGGLETIWGRLKTIDVTANGNRVRTYALAYKPTASAKTARSLLDSVTQLGSNATLTATGVATGTSLPATTFTYYDASNGGTAAQEPTNAFAAGFWTHWHSRFLTGDFDGNGKTDFLIAQPKDGEGYSVATTYANTFLSDAGANAAGQPAFRMIDSKAFTYGFWTDRYTRFLTGDFDADGKTDFIGIQPMEAERPRWPGHYTLASTTAYTHLSNGDGTFGDRNSQGFPAGFWTDMFTRFLPGDFDGDGATDFIAIQPRVMECAGCYSNYDLGTTYANTFLSNRDGTFRLVDSQAFPSGFYSDTLTWFLPGDFNGDGKTDFVSSGWNHDVTAKDTSTFLSNGNGTFTRVAAGGFTGVSELFVGDYNGDGKTDLLSLQETSRRGTQYYPSTLGWTYLSNGNGTFTEVANALPAGHVSDEFTMYVPGDFNGDGRADFAAVQPVSATYANTFLADGRGKFRQVATGAFGSNYWADINTRFLPGDFDGSGQGDFVALQTKDGVSSSGQRFSIAGTYANLFRMGVNEYPGTPLWTVRNGTGGLVSLAYRPSSAWSNTNNPPVMLTVTDVETSDGNGVGAIETRTYADGYFHRSEREFRGFGVVEVLSPTGPSGEQSATQVWFHQGDDVAVDANDPSAVAGYTKGKPYRVRVWDVPRSTFSEKETTYWPAAAPSYFAPPREIVERECKYSEQSDTVTCGASVRTTYAEFQAGLAVPAYDVYGNRTRENQYGDPSVATDDRTLAHTWAKNTSRYIVGLMASETVHAGALDDAGLGTLVQKSRTDYEYDGSVGTDCATYAVGAELVRGDLTRATRWLNGGTSPETWMKYDSAGNVVCSSDPDRRVTKFGYDPTKTFRTSVTNAKNHVTTTEYYGVEGVPADKGLHGQPKKVTDPNQSVTSFEYDVFGRRTKEIQPAVPTPLQGKPFAGLMTTTTYVLDGGVGTNRIETTTSDGAGQVLRWSAAYFDGLGRTFLTKKKGSATGRVIATKTKFNATGTTWGTSLPYEDVTGAALRWTSFGYDGKGRVTLTTRPDGTRQLGCYDDLERSAVTIDENDHRLRRTFDARRNVSAVQEYLGAYDSCTTEVGPACVADAPAGACLFATTTYEYDAFDRVLTVLDAKDAAYATDYDTLGRKVFSSDPDLGTWYYEAYSAAGDLEIQKDGNGNRIVFQYDALHRVKEKTYQDGKIVSYTYDGDDDPTAAYAKGLLTKTEDGSSATTAGSTTIAHYYDALGRPWKTARLIDGNWYTSLTDYDASGRLGASTYPDGAVISYAYDVDGFLWKVEGAGSPAPWATLTGYNALGQVGTLGFRNGVTTQYRYYDTTNNRLKSIVTAPSGASALVDLTLTYDNAGNVKTIQDGVNSSQGQSFGYDELNRLTFASSQAYGPLTDEDGNAIAAGFVRFTHDPVKVHQVTSSTDGRSYSYDDNGNMRSDGRRTIGYDYENRVSSVLLGGATTAFAYAATERVMKAGPSGTIIYAGKHYECAGAICTKHIFAGDRLLASVSSDGSIRYYHADHLGSTRVVTNQPATGQAVQVLERLFYLPFGATVSDTAPGMSSHKFTSQQRDAETRLYFYGARYYNPWLGRFLSPDVLIPRMYDPQSLNRYSYARNNPVRIVDPTGHYGEDFEDFEWAPPSFYDPSLGLYQSYAASDPALLLLDLGGPAKESDSLQGGGGPRWRPPLLDSGTRAGSEDERGDPRRQQIELFYGIEEGTLLAFSGDDIAARFDATSGRADCMNNRGCVDQVKQGPIYPGPYRLETAELQVFSLPRALYHAFVQGRGGGDWGSFRVTLHPEFETKRDGFFIHGGSIPGSAGCIDLGGGLLGDARTAQFITLVARDADGIVHLTVRESLGIPILPVVPGM